MEYDLGIRLDLLEQKLNYLVEAQAKKDEKIKKLQEARQNALEEKKKPIKEKVEE